MVATAVWRGIPPFCHAGMDRAPSDRPGGIAAARAAGMACIGLAPFGDDPELRAVGAVLIGSLDELPSILRAAMDQSA